MQVSNEYLPGTLAYGSPYYWRIDEINANGLTPGRTWKFITEEATPAENTPAAPEGLSFDLYPNPVSDGIVYVDYILPEASELSVSIIDLYGRVLRNDRKGMQPQGSYRHVLDCSGLEGGAYLVMIHTGREYRAVRIIITEN